MKVISKVFKDHSNYGKNVYELEDHSGQGALSSKLFPKFGFVKKILHAHLLNRLLKIFKSNLHFLMPSGPSSKG